MDDQGYTTLRSFRYERKFLVENLLPFQVAALIKYHPRIFYAPYPPRYVNNLYLDTPDMTNYFDNINGAIRRRKVRIRWYGEPFGLINRPMLEIKVKDGLVGTKYTHPFPPFHLDTQFCNPVFRQILSASNLPSEVQYCLRGLNLVLFNRYFRHYYATQDGAFRLTLDTQQTFYRFNGTFGNSFVHHQKNAKDVVLELKYEIDNESQADRISGFFPFRASRNSKYVQGIERVYF